MKIITKKIGFIIFIFLIIKFEIKSEIQVNCEQEIKTTNQEIKKDKEQKIILIGIPKCGTFLLKEFYWLLTRKLNGINRLHKHEIFAGEKNFEKATQLFMPSLELLDTLITNLNINEYLLCHLTYKPEYEELLKKKNFKVILIIRHPGAQLVSRVFYTQDHEGYFPALSALSFEELLSGYIGIGALEEQKFEDLYSSHISYKQEPKYKALSNISKFYENYLGWINSPICYTVKFEDLVGPKGEGNLEAQICEIIKLSKFCGYYICESKAREIADKLFGGTVTFREGSTNSWKKYFNCEQKKALKQIANKLITDLKYEFD